MNLFRHFSILGVGGRLSLFFSRKCLKRFLPAWTTTLKLRGYPHPFHFRHGTTDRYVIDEVLIKSQYSVLTNLRDIRNIVDAGANIGTTSVYLLNAYPHASLVALEPAPGNFEMLRKNLRYYGDRAMPIEGALWSHERKLSLDVGTFRDGGEWSIRVAEAPSRNREEIQAFSVVSLLRKLAWSRIDILKVDIEGAERIVFGASDVDWLDSVRFMAIELHDDVCHKAFSNGIQRFGGQLRHFGETTFWKRDGE